MVIGANKNNGGDGYAEKINNFNFFNWFLFSCVTPKITKPPEESIDFKQYKKVKLVVFDEVKTPYSINGMPMFEELLKGKLQSLGYSMVEQDEDMLLETRITDFKPGSAALRFWVSFGAGKAVLIYILQVLKIDRENY